MNDLQLIKKRIIHDDVADRIYEAMGCDFISFKGGRIEAQLPDRFHSTNKRAVQTKLNESLSSSIRNKIDFEGGDIFALVSYIVGNKRGEEIQKDLPNAKKFICETLGWTEFLSGGAFEHRVDYAAPLKAIVKNKHKKKESNPNPILPESVLNEFLPYPSYQWFKEGISYKTQQLYQIGFCLDSKRITIPMRNRFGKLVGVKGRIMNDEDDDRKYLYLYRYQNRLEWFNFYHAHQHILTNKRVYLFEAEKSCMLCHTYGIYNALAIGGSDISEEQAQMIKQLGIDIEIFLCYDSDKTPPEIHKQARYFEGREVYALYGGSKVLGKKSAPIDRGINIFNELVEKAITPDELLQHYNEYLQNKNKKSIPKH